MGKKILYELARPHWDGSKLHERSDQLYFPEGEAPRDAIDVAARDKQAKADAKAHAAEVKAEGERMLAEAKALEEAAAAAKAAEEEAAKAASESAAAKKA